MRTRNREEAGLASMVASVAGPVSMADLYCSDGADLLESKERALLIAEQWREKPEQTCLRLAGTEGEKTRTDCPVLDIRQPVPRP